MLRKPKILLMSCLLLLAFAQVAYPALQAVGPVLPDTNTGPNWSAGYNGFPLWYRDSLGQTVGLSVPPAAVSIPDPVLAGNSFSAQIGFGSEAMYWHSTATQAVPGGQALLVMALEAAFGGGDALDKDQITFARVRIRIDTAQAGDYTVIHPYGTKTYLNVPVGTRAINDTVDVGIGAQGDFSGALQGAIGPFLKQTTPPPPAGTLGDAVTLSPVTGSPTGNNFFQVIGPGVNATTNLFVTGAQLYPGTPFTITRTTYNRDAAGATVAQLFADIPLPLLTGQIPILTAFLPGQTTGGVRLTRTQENYFRSIPFPTNPTIPVGEVRINGTLNGANLTALRSKLVDVVDIIQADYSLANQTLTIAAMSTDQSAPAPILTGSGWKNSAVTGTNVLPSPALGPPVLNVFGPVPIPPATITVSSDRGGLDTFKTNIVP